MQYNFKTALGKLKYLLIAILPFAIDMFLKAYPQLANMSLTDMISFGLDKIYPNLSGLTIGAILILIFNAWKFKQTVMGRQKREIENRKGGGL